MSTLTFPILQTSKPADAKKLAKLNRRALPSLELATKVRTILDDVRENGDKAVCACTKRFDGISIKPGELHLRSEPTLPPAKVRRAISHSLKNIKLFSQGRRPRDWRGTNAEGAIVGEQYRPFDRVGIYVPGGTAPLVSTSLMTVGIARVAGVKEIAVTTPPPVDNNLHYALRAAGATEIYHAGGAQAIAALAFGTKTIPAVQMIAGPGNAYVVEAKRQVVGAVAIDLLPGPSEIAVLCDSTANPKFVAADLLAQAEHGHGSQVLMVSPSAKMLERVQKEMNAQLPSLSRQEYLKEVLELGTSFVHARSMAEAVEVVEDFAPEHLSLVAKNGRLLAKSIRNAGAIFLGNYSPVAAGDFLAGPSHTLPTGGAGKSFPGLCVQHFYKRTSVVEYQPKHLAKVVPHIETFAEVEHLDAHGRSASIRLDS